MGCPSSCPLRQLRVCRPCVLPLVWWHHVTHMLSSLVSLDSCSWFLALQALLQNCPGAWPLTLESLFRFRERGLPWALHWRCLGLPDGPDHTRPLSEESPPGTLACFPLICVCFHICPSTLVIFSTEVAPVAHGDVILSWRRLTMLIDFYCS